MPVFGKRRAYGQHYLKDSRVIDKIVGATLEFAQKNDSKTILEIGPGRGALTLPLVQRLGADQKLLIAERDAGLVTHWREVALPKTELFEGDFLDLPESLWLRPNLTVVSNLPYSAGTAIFTRLAAHPKQVSSLTLMFQQEVAFRLRAEQQTKSWGSLSIWTQNQWEIQKLISVSPQAFMPPPDVDSEVVTLIPREIPYVDTSPDPEGWNQLLKTFFAHRRKMIRSGIPKTGVFRTAFETSGIDGTKRSEALDWAEWKKLYQAFLVAKEG